MSVTSTAELSLAQLLAVPYLLDVSAGPGPDGTWVCRLAYPELPGCVAESRDPLLALDDLERQREEWLTGRLAAGLPCPVPRPPLRA